MKKSKLHIQNASQSKSIPTNTQFQQWIEEALHTQIQQPKELTLRIVDEAESAKLNADYRHKQGPTNVLSFPFEPPPGLQELPILGDIVICAPCVTREAAEQDKNETAHWAHLVIHGVLHLLGYNHIKAEEATTMETLEIEILQGLGFGDPYAEN